MSALKLNLIGPGRVGRTLLGLFRDCPGVTVQDVASGNPDTARDAVREAGVGQARDLAGLRPADIWVLAVPDTKIAQVAEDLALACVDHSVSERGPVAFHCSGFYAASEMASLRALGWHLASVHPVLSFADSETAIHQFAGTHCGIEGDAPAEALLWSLVEQIGGRPFRIRSESKSLYHAAAVFSNNFAVVLQALAREAWGEAGVPPDVAEALNASLLRATCENVTIGGPQAALTGPAARGDTDVVRRQAQDVTGWHPEAGALYRMLSDMAVRLKGTGKTG